MKYFLQIIFILTVIINNLYSQMYQDWKWLHQSPQGNDLRWVKMWDVNTIYAIGANGTFIKTTNRGVNWTMLHNAGRLSGIPQQRADLYDAWFFDQNTGIVTGAYGSIFRTTNGGISFEEVPNNPAPVNLNIKGISFINNLTGYVIGQLSNYRLMKTTDGGLNWNASYGTAPPYVNPYELHAFTENKLLVLNGLGDVCITSNGGYTWTTYPIGNLVNFYKTEFINANTGFACGDWGRCRYTTDGGYNWINIAGSLFNRELHFFDVDYRNGNVYLTGYTPYIYKSSNLGLTWDSISFIAPPAQLPWNNFYASEFSVTGDTMFTVGAAGGMHQSLGNTRITHSQYMRSGNLRDIWVSSSGMNMIAVGAPSSATSSLTTHDQIMRSVNGGLNWTVNSPLPNSIADFYSIEMLDNNTGFICGSMSAVYKTSNGGISWDSLVITNMPLGLTLTKVDFVSAQTGWIFSKWLSGQDSTIYKTTNGGASWFRQKLGPMTGSANTINTAHMLDENNGWVINSRPKPWKTTNGGITWDSTLLSDNYQAATLNDIRMINNLTGYCVGGNNRTYKTTNGGATPWVNVSFSSGTVYTLYAVEVNGENEASVMGTFGKCAYTSNGGVNWITKDISSTNSIYGSFMTPDRTVYAVTLTDAYVLKNSALLTSADIKNVNNEIPKDFILHQNFPNPFNPATNIRFELPAFYKEGIQWSNVTFKIYNSLGQHVETLINEFLKPGEYEVRWDASGYSSGLYFFELISGEKRETRKMLLIK
jgi:photosystem II stability/assembly factor-like uncharacterized protein